MLKISNIMLRILRWQQYKLMFKLSYIMLRILKWQQYKPKVIYNVKCDILFSRSKFLLKVLEYLNIF